MNRHLPKLWLKAGRETPLLAGHPWIFSKGIEKGPFNSVGEKFDNVGLVEVNAYDDKFLGIGAFNPRTSISVRMLGGPEMEKIDTLDVEFFEKRFLALEKLKREFLLGAAAHPAHRTSHATPGLSLEHGALAPTTAYRLVNADADWLPGLIVDCYNDVLVFQIHTAGMDLFRAEIVEGLKRAFSPRAIVERSDIDSRKSDGLQSLPLKIHHGEVNEPVEFLENNVKFLADVLMGQKTGFFLDQRDARKKVGEIAKGKRILNLFSYTGGFGLYAALNGASKVTTVDVSEKALELAVKNFKLNGLDVESETGQEKYEFVCGDVFDYLQEIKIWDYDLIVCDPPAFAKSNDKVDEAKKAYTTINRRCMELLNHGGILVTSSCSGRISQEDFRDIIKFSAGRSKKDMRILASLTQPFDHTERVCFPEGRYLKTLVLQCLKNF